MSPLTIEQEQSLSNEINPIVLRSQARIIKTPDQSLLAQEDIKDNKAKQKKIKEFFKPMKDAAKASHQAICDRENSFLEPLIQAEEIDKKKVIVFQAEEDRKREEQTRKDEAARQERERKERERIEAQAAAARAAGKTEKAEALEEKAASVVAEPTFKPSPAASKAQGTSFKSIWKGEITDIKALCQSILDGRVAPDVIAPNDSAINKLAGVCKNQMVIPGLKFYEEKVMSVRS